MMMFDIVIANKHFENTISTMARCINCQIMALSDFNMKKYTVDIYLVLVRSRVYFKVMLTSHAHIQEKEQRQSFLNSKPC